MEQRVVLDNSFHHHLIPTLSPWSLMEKVLGWCSEYEIHPLTFQLNDFRTHFKIHHSVLTIQYSCRRRR
jgi:hypothetical protein